MCDLNVCSCLQMSKEFTLGLTGGKLDPDFDSTDSAPAAEGYFLFFVVVLIVVKLCFLQSFCKRWRKGALLLLLETYNFLQHFDVMVFTAHKVVS